MPLTPTARAGLLAAGLTLSLFAACGGIVAVAVLAGGGKGEPAGQPDRQSGQADRTTGQPLADRPVSEGRADDDESYVAGHRWWRKRMGKADLDRVVRFIVETNAGQAVWVDDRGNTARGEGFPLRGGGMYWEPPGEGWADRRAVRVTAWPDRRMTRADALAALRSRLDAAEAEGGPGR